MSSASEGSGETVYVIAVVVGVLASAVLVPVAFQATQPAEPDRVMVLSYDGGITDAQVDKAVNSLREARTSDSIRGVVIEMNSPGGAVTASERLYKAVQHTSEELPVAVAVKSVAASGGYYGSIAADRIFTQPSATIGSVGVFVPSGVELPDSIVRSSPDKAEQRAETVRRNVEQLQGTFVSSVMRERGPDSDHGGTALQVDQSEVEMAHTYIGSRAVENGFADELGGTRNAVVWVAGQANLDSYEISRVETNVSSEMSLLLSDDTAKVVVKDGTTLRTMQSQYYALSLEHVPTVIATEEDSAGSATPSDTDAQSTNESLSMSDEDVTLGGAGI